MQVLVPTRSRLRRPVAAALLAAALAAGGVAGLATPAEAAPVCGGTPAPTFGTASLNGTLNTRFTNYGNNNSLLDDWTGADSTYSLKLPDGRIAFAFSDTFLGRVNSNGSRPPTIEDGGTTPFIRNSYVIQSGSTLRTVHAGTAADPTSPVPPRDATHWYWAGDLTLNGGQVQQVFREYVKTGPGPWDFRWDRNALATFSAADLSRPQSMRSLPSGHGVQWGSALLKADGDTYIYGTEDAGGTKYLHVARVSGSDLGGTWSFLAAGGGWSSSETASARVMAGVSNEFSVTKRGNFYILINQDTKQAFSAEIDAHLSCSPAGPFTDEKLLYLAWENGGNPRIYSYNAHAHASLSTTGNIVVSYNVNSLDDRTTPDKDVYADVRIYRPRFVNVPVSG